MNSEVAAIRNELKGLGVRNSFRGATKSYMAELLNRLKHNTAEVPPQLRTTEALRMARSNEYRALIGKHSLKKLALHLPASLWKHYKKFGWLQLDLGLSEREKRMVALCHRVALCELVRRVRVRVRVRVRRASHKPPEPFVCGTSTCRPHRVSTRPTRRRTFARSCCSSATRAAHLSRRSRSFLTGCRPDRHDDVFCK